MQFIDRIITFLTDRDRRLSSKAAFIVILFVAIVVVDNFIGVSYNYRTDKRIEQVQKINIILRDSSLDRATHHYFVTLRNDIIKRKSLVDYTLSFFRNIKLTNSKKAQTSKPNDIAKPIDVPKSETSVPIRNNFIFLMTSGGLYILFAVIMLPLFLFMKMDATISQRLGTAIMTAFIFLVSALFFYWLCDFIPLLSKDTWFWNYALNVVIQAFLTWIFFIISKQAKA